MKKIRKEWLRSGLITLFLLALAFGISMVVDSLFEAQPLIPLFFVLAVNFVFTYPFLPFDFEVMENAVSALIIMVVSISTCALTQKINRHEQLRSELQKEKMRGIC